MKYIALVVLLLPFLASGQMPLPCLEYNNSNVGLLQGFEGEVSVNCLTIQEGDEPNVSIHNDRVRSFHVNEAQINSFFEVKNVGNGEFNIDLNPSVGFDCAWMEPNTYDVPQYDKVEWGIKLPEEIQNRIESWILNQSIDNVQPTDINPFDPDQIKIQAKIWYDQGDNNWTSSPAIIDGFYYVPFFRDMSSADKNNWDWTEIETEYTFRVRWAPVYRTSHRVVLSYWTPEGSQEFSAFYFDSTPTNPSKSFISVSGNGHYFVTKDDQLFFPTGVNFWEDVFNCRCDFDEAKGPLIDQRGDEVILSDQECAECYLKGTDDVCALLKIRKLRGSYAAKDYNNIRNMCTPLPGYLKFHERLDELKDSGGNSIRMHFNGPTFEIEFEKLNNYFDRQYQAWEFDRVLDHCKEKDIRIDLNLQIHNAVTILKYFRNNWDWNNYDNNGNPDPNDLGWCYWRELGLDPEKPLDFFTNQEAITNYKKKLRYIVARWGYSTSIYAMELFSEINNVGIGEYSFEDSQAGLSRPSGYDDGEAGVQEAVYAWHQEISGFIKNDLQHRRQLLAVEYAAIAPFEAYFSLSDQTEAKGRRDQSMSYSDIDVISYSAYKQDKGRFGNMGRGYHQFLEDQNLDEDEGGYQQYYRSISKPIIYGESGIFDTYDCDLQSGVKQIFVQPFTGGANTGYLWHGQSKKKSWEYFHKFNSFLNLSKLAFGFNFSSAGVVPFYEWEENYKKPMVNALINRDQYSVIGVMSDQRANWSRDNCFDLMGSEYVFDMLGGDTDMIREIYGVQAGHEDDPIPYNVYYDEIRHYPYKLGADIGDFNLFWELLNVKIENFESGRYTTYYFTPDLDLLDVRHKHNWVDGDIRIDFIEENLFSNYIFFIMIKDDENKVYHNDHLTSVNDLVLFPNPGNGIFRVNDLDSEDLVEIYNSLGRLIYKANAVEGSFDFSGFSNGLYLVKVNGKTFNYLKVE